MSGSYLFAVIVFELHEVTDSMAKAVLVSEEWHFEYQMLHGVHHTYATGVAVDLYPDLQGLPCLEGEALLEDIPQPGPQPLSALQHVAS